MEELHGSKVFVVLNVKEGDGFGFTKEAMIVSCSLNGHTLETDPVSSRNTPIFDSELIWETNKKALRSLRLQNVPLKVQVVSVSGKRIGYLLLSLLAAKPCSFRKHISIGHSWHRLLGVGLEGKSSEPQLLLRLTIQDHDNSLTPASSVQSSRPCMVDKNIPEMEETETSGTIQSLERHFQLIGSELGEQGDTNRISLLKEQLLQITDSQEKLESVVVESEENIPILPAEESLSSPVMVENTTTNLDESEEGEIDLLTKKDGTVILKKKQTEIEKEEIDERHNTTFTSHYNDRNTGNRRQHLYTKLDQGDCLRTNNNEFLKECDEIGRSSDRSLKETVMEEAHCLEEWRERQQQLIGEELKGHQERLLSHLEEEWYRQGAGTLKGAQRCQVLMQQLLEAQIHIAEASQRLQERENKLRLAKDELEMHYVTKYHELNESSKRMEEDFNHRASMQQHKYSQLETEYNHLKKINMSLQEKIKSYEEEMTHFRSSYVPMDDLRNIVEEKKYLETKLESAIQSKAFFKDQWATAMRDVQILKLKYNSCVPAVSSDSCTFRDILETEESLLNLDHAALQKLKDDVMNEELLSFRERL